MYSTAYIIRFVLIMTTVVALLLALLATGLKPLHDKNAKIYNRRAILSAVDNEMPKKSSELTDKEIASIFENEINAIALNNKGEAVEESRIIEAGYPSGNVDAIDPVKERKKDPSNRLSPLFIYTSDKGDKYYITSMAGSGLWDAIWGNIALQSDFITIAGASFDHAAETPGLGAEIKDNQAWKNQFIGKKIYNDKSEYTGVEVMKGVVQHPSYQVDGISGATITSDGVEEMVKRGLRKYETYFKENGLSLN